MSRITVIGGTGYSGAAVVDEAVKRGHTVTAVSRSVPTAPIDGVTYLQGSALEADVRARALDGADAVVIATAARGDMAEKQLDMVRMLAEDASALDARVLFVGGFSSLRPAEGAPRFIEGDVPEQYRVEAHAGHAVLEYFASGETDARWTFLSPAAQFGAWIDQPPTGGYTLGGEVTDLSNGPTFLHAADLALAIVDILEGGTREREHVSVVSS